MVRTRVEERDEIAEIELRQDEVTVERISRLPISSCSSTSSMKPDRVARVMVDGRSRLALLTAEPGYSASTGVVPWEIETVTPVAA